MSEDIEGKKDEEGLGVGWHGNQVVGKLEDTFHKQAFLVHQSMTSYKELFGSLPDLTKKVGAFALKGLVAYTQLFANQPLVCLRELADDTVSGVANILADLDGVGSNRASCVQCPVIGLDDVGDDPRSKEFCPGKERSEEGNGEEGGG